MLNASVTFVKLVFAVLDAEVMHSVAQLQLALKISAEVGSEIVTFSYV